jgi:putative copper resistance protein D
LRALVLLTVFVALIGATLLALYVGGAANPLALADPGAVVRFGLPLVTAVAQLAMATSIGTLVLASFAMADKGKTLAAALNLVAVSSIVWVMFGAVQLVFSYLSATGLGFSTSNQFGQGLWLFASQIELGRNQLINLALGLVVSTLAISVRRLTAVLFTAVLALLALVPLALSGHASGTANHGLAVNALGLHLVGVSIWVGGIVALIVLHRSVGLTLELILRYSTLALVAFFLVLTSGLASGWLRIGSWQGVLSPYGQLLLAKTALLVLLGLFGARHRRFAIKKFAAAQSGFVRLIAVEAILMAATVGIAAALSRTAPPVNPTLLVGTSPAEILTGQKLPPELTFDRYFTEFKLDPLWLAVCALGIIGYLVGVTRLRRRGDKWSPARTISWMFGMLLLAYITNGAFNAYQEYLFSVHMMAHMLLSMAVPILLVPGAPITLISRATEKRHDDSRGLREWVLWAVHTKYAQFISHPIIAGLLFATSLVVFYYTPLFGWATREHIGHEWMVVHFVITGYLFVQALIGIDPGPHRLPYAMRIGLLILVLAFHAFFGLAVMTGNGLLLADWFGAMGRTWGQAPIDDQHTGGAIAWGIGELPTAVLTIIVSVQWFKSDAREARRLDRAADRGDNKDLENYNAMLARLAERDAKSGDK